jgi:glycosyltransferase involved in cell wall biosynthesis
MLRSDGTISTLPIRSETCARCLGEEQRRYRVPGRLFPGWMNVYWRLRRGSVERAARRTQTLREELNQADRIICPSRFLMEIHQSEGIDPRKMIHSRQGRDFPDLAPEALAKTPADTLRLGYIGQIAEIKGVHLLFEAARQLPASRLRVRAYGDTAPFPQYTARLRNMAAADARLELCGAFQKHEVTAVMQTLDAIVVPSVWYENSPNVILEAFAHRTPVIASNLGGMAELIEHGKNGLLFTPNDPADLARQIERLNREPALLEQLRQGIEPIKAVSQEMDELEAVYACLTRLS